MNLCSLGWHDFEVINEKELLKNILINYLKEQGFKEIKGDYGSVWKKYEGYAIREWGFDYNETIEGCMPCTVQSKVCVKCGHIKLTYNPDKCIEELQELIKEYDNIDKRRQIAERLRWVK